MTLAELIQHFVMHHPEMADQQKAWGQCDVMTDKFLNLAYEMGYTDQLQRFSFDAETEPNRNPAPKLYDVLVPGTRQIRRNESTAMMCTWHCIVDAGHVLIDFTARQYSKSLPFPLIIPVDCSNAPTDYEAYAAKAGA